MFSKWGPVQDIVTSISHPGVGLLRRTMAVNTSPEIVVEVDGENVKFTIITMIKTNVISFTLGTEHQADSPGGR